MFKKPFDALYDLVALEQRVIHLETKTDSMERNLWQLNCTHPIERRATGFTDTYFIKCNRCDKILERFNTKRDLLYYQLRQLKEQIANLPDEDEEEEDGET